MQSIIVFIVMQSIIVYESKENEALVCVYFFVRLFSTYKFIRRRDFAFRFTSNFIIAWKIHSCHKSLLSQKILLFVILPVFR